MAKTYMRASIENRKAGGVAVNVFMQRTKSFDYVGSTYGDRVTYHGPGGTLKQSVIYVMEGDRVVGVYYVDRIDDYRENREEE